MCSGTCFQILLLCLVFCLVECGKDPAKREIDSVVSNSSNKLEKGEKEEQVGPGKKFLVPDLETTQNGTSATFSITVSADGTLDDSNDDENPKKGLTEIPKPRPGFAYFAQLQDLISQVITFLGFRSHVERIQRGLNFDGESNEVNYREGVKTTLGAVMGEDDCRKKVTCRAGKYLHDVKGKEVILVILEKVTPSTWMETIKILKKSAIQDEKCTYTCLES